ncbi:MAG TPA: hypothetical protein VG797_05120, partial [Phycisphaerales bacterium]|nr:hypothetical protein [Phycisphaerales bacterium]
PLLGGATLTALNPQVGVLRTEFCGIAAPDVSSEDVGSIRLPTGAASALAQIIRAYAELHLDTTRSFVQSRGSTWEDESP